MKKMLKKVLFGFLLWVSIFIGSMIIFVIYESDRIFFETLISIILILNTMLYAVLYFKKIETDFVNEGIKVGLIWMLINLLIDIPMFSFGPMARDIWDYFKDIGFMYISFPIITISIGYLLSKKLS